jgi:glucokinase
LASADVIAITSSQSALAKKATVCLAVDHTEDSSAFLSMISRILQLLLIDILSVGISLDEQNAELVLEHKANGVVQESRRLQISHLDN